MVTGCCGTRSACVSPFIVTAWPNRSSRHVVGRRRGDGDSLAEMTCAEPGCRVETAAWPRNLERMGSRGSNHEPGRSYDERWRHLAGERLKFRCYQCNQLLASAPGKAGSIVSCPRCKADLVVPAPESPAPADPESSSVGKMSGRGADAHAAEADRPRRPRRNRGGHPRRPDRSPARGPAGRSRVFPEPHPRARSPQGSRAGPLGRAEPAAAYPRSRRAFPRHRPFSPAIETPAAPAARPEPRHAAALGGPDSAAARPGKPRCPADRDRAPFHPPPNGEFHPVREVVLPASAVLAWSLFGLIGIATSFIAGLMVGHYFWRM